MSCSSQSQPPPSLLAIMSVAHSGPGMARCTPERATLHTEVTQWFARWCAERRISERDLASILDVSAPLARKKLRGESPLNLTDIARFPVRHRNDLMLAYISWRSTCDSLLAHA
jgi:hypothetical protein